MLGAPPAAPEGGEQSAAGPLAGVTVGITGTLEGMTREEAAAAVQGLGGKVAGSVSKKTDFLVAGANAGSKYDKALALGVPVLDEAGLGVLLDHGPAAAHDAVGPSEPSA